MTKKQTEQWCRYLESFIKHGVRDLYQAYKTCSSKKFNAWCSIRNDCDIKHDKYLTVTGAGSHYFSTDFLYKEEGVWHWVHDCYSYRTDIELTEDMITEARRAGICLEI
ncbi:MAG: hypothetical protein IKQ22_00860 [Clostridia bacterium]|nr:hypothetical protein [Clostridia bacterium]